MKLEDKMFLYHGSFAKVEEIDLTKCKKGKDFGRDFYVTSSYEQAMSFVSLSINKQVNEGNLPRSCGTGYVSVFKLNLTEALNIYMFSGADKKWLHFVAFNRRGSLFPALREAYDRFDIIGGKIANDRTARTLQLYTSGGYGEPGTQEAADIAIATLLPNRLKDQFCFCSERAVKALEFIRSEKYDTHGK